MYLILFIAILSCCSTVEAHYLRDERDLFESTLARLNRKGEILVDSRPDPSLFALDLKRRQNTPFDNTQSTAQAASAISASAASHISKSSASTAAPAPTASTGGKNSASESTSTATDSSAPSSTPSTSSSGLATQPAPTGGPLPSAFDTSLGSNFTTSACPNFFNSFLQNSTFKACLPLSLLLQNSNSFFQAEKSIVTITQTLEASCNVDFATCTATMADFATQIRDDTTCGADFQRQNPLVLQAYNGFIAYAPMYQAGCLRDSSGDYCFADAITNFTSPTDSYVYYVGLGLPLPGGSRPTCNSCLQNTMSIFANASSNSSQPVSQQYVQTAQVIDLNCGPNFVNTTIPASKGAASGVRSPLDYRTGALVAILFTLGHLLL
ncbi:MAG: hypothetical protein M1838_002204 [Thelocarpon superellum]|nr:MAG: hypothetical protein M1838_002204 [Thelocarpon superellum]